MNNNDTNDKVEKLKAFLSRALLLPGAVSRRSGKTRLAILDPQGRKSPYERMVCAERLLQACFFAEQRPGRH